MSRRLSASGRLTRGVAHEVKNPINAIVLHLQLLQTKLQEIDPDTRRHINIIDSEIHRLDRVVQILVEFLLPVAIGVFEAAVEDVVHRPFQSPTLADTAAVHAAHALVAEELHLLGDHVRRRLRTVTEALVAAPVVEDVVAKVVEGRFAFTIISPKRGLRPL